MKIEKSIFKGVKKHFYLRSHPQVQTIMIMAIFAMWINSMQLMMHLKGTLKQPGM